MNFINSIYKRSKDSGKQVKETTTDVLCPNCWGRQEYEGHFYKAIKAKTIKEEKNRKGWIRSYVQEHIKNSVLPKHKKQTCNVCYVNDN